jgi:hypothetical protein
MANSLPNVGTQRRDESEGGGKWAVHAFLYRDDWTGKAVVGGLPINLALSAQFAFPHQNSSNGLYDTLQRALGPQLEEAASCCRLFISQTHCRLFAPSIHPSSVSVQVTAQHDRHRRHAAAYRKDSSRNL